MKRRINALTKGIEHAKAKIQRIMRKGQIKTAFAYFRVIKRKYKPSIIKYAHRSQMRVIGILIKEYNMQLKKQASLTRISLH